MSESTLGNSDSSEESAYLPYTETPNYSFNAHKEKEPSQEFDYDAVDRGAFDFDKESEYEQVAKLLNAFRSMLSFVLQGRDDRARCIRLQAVRVYIRDKNKNQVELGEELGVGKAAINQQSIALRDYLKQQTSTDVRAQGMRSEQARQTFSKVCKSSHQQRKSSSTKSAPKLTQNIESLYDSRMRRLKTEQRQSSQQLNVVSY